MADIIELASTRIGTLFKICDRLGSEIRTIKYANVRPGSNFNAKLDLSSLAAKYYKILVSCIRVGRNKLSRACASTSHIPSSMLCLGRLY